MTSFVSFASLRRDDTINSRTADEDQNLDELIASIKTDGLLQPLLVRRGEEEGTFKIIDGHRRFRALSAIGGYDAVPVHVRTADDADARSMSLATNILRLPLHPADQFKAFAALVDEGLEEGAIAARFGLEVKAVRQRLALGKVIPEILEAYRAGKMQLEAVQIFAGAGVERQKKAFDVVSQKTYFNHWDIKQALGEGTVHEKMKEFVGRDRYLAAGGRMETDLFSGVEVWLDPDKALVLANDRLKEVIAEYQAEGWAFVRHEVDMPDNWENQYMVMWGEDAPTPEQEQRIEEIDKRIAEIEDIDGDNLSAEEEEKLVTEQYTLEGERDEIVNAIPTVFTDEQKKRGGVVIRKDWSIEMREDRKAAKSGGVAAEPAAAKPKPENKEWNSALLDDLQVELTGAAQMAIAREPEVADILLLTALYLKTQTGYEHSPMLINMGDTRRHPEVEAYLQTQVKGFGFKGKTFWTHYENIAELSKEDREKLRAVLVARALSKLAGHEDTGKMFVRLATKQLSEVWKPDAAFFERLSLSQLSEVHKEMSGFGLAEGLKKKEAVAMVLKQAEARRWVPRHMSCAVAVEDTPRNATPKKEKKPKAKAVTVVGEDGKTAKKKKAA